MKREGLRHPKTLDLMARLSINRREAIGLLDLLFDFAMDYAPRGDIGKWGDGVIAGAVDWIGDAAVLVAALTDSGWLDKHDEHRLIIHDWPHHAPSFVGAKLKKIESSFLDCYKNPEYSEHSTERSSEPTIPLLSSPQTPSPPAPAAAQRNGAADAAVVELGEWEKARPLARRIKDAVYPNVPKLGRKDWLWVARVAVLGIRYGPSWIEPAFEALNSPNVKSPRGLMASVLDDECERNGTRLNRELPKIEIPKELQP